MVMLRPPGVIMERADADPRRLGLLPAGVPGFLGLAERGPTNVPVKITSPEAFREIFGILHVPDGPEPYLGTAVDGFFLNGGKECWIVRVAHLFERGRGEVATKAHTRVKDHSGRNTLVVQASSEGIWGNQVKVSVRRPEPRVQTFITLDAREGEIGVTVKSTHGFSRGTVVKIFDDLGEPSYRMLTLVEGRNLWWDEREPLEREYRSGAPTMIEPVEFEITAETPSRREIFRGLVLAKGSPFYVERMVNGVSRLLRVTDLNSGSPVPQNLPVAVQNVPLEGGLDGLFTVTAEDFIGADMGPDERFGLAALAVLEDIDLIVAPDLIWCDDIRRLFAEGGKQEVRTQGFRTQKDIEIVQQAIVDVCEDRKDRFAILDVPPGLNHTGAMQWRLFFDTSHAAFYFPALIVEEKGKRRLVPPSGHVAGIYTRCDDAQGVYRAPANESLEGVVDLDLILQDEDVAMLTAEGINCIRPLPHRGIRVWGARTAASDPLLRYVNVRRTIVAIVRALNHGLQWVVFEPNNHDLWASIARDVGFFLHDLWKRGYFRGDTADAAFYVQCDEETNQPETVEKGQLHVSIGVAPVRPAEFISFRVTQAIDATTRGAAD